MRWCFDGEIDTIQSSNQMKGGDKMLVIRLFCNQGMSTSILVNKMREAAVKEGIEVDIMAYPISEMEFKLEGVDCALLGPQVRYMKESAEKICDAKGVPMDIIAMQDYGMCNGVNVLKFARKLARKSEKLT